MNYELAKQLRDAGYPQHESGYYINKDNILHEDPDAFDPSVPTVRELRESVEELLDKCEIDKSVVGVIERLAMSTKDDLSEVFAEWWLQLIEDCNGNLPRALSNK